MALQRILREQNRKALKLLESWHDEPSDHIHRSRQSFRRIRAVVRLLRPVAPYIYDVENRFYRDTGQQLSNVRDSNAMVEAIEFLERTFDCDAPKDSLAMLKTSLRRRVKNELEGSSSDIAVTCSDVAEELEMAGRRLHGIPLDGVKLRHLKRSTRKGLRSCGKAFRKFRRYERAEDLHAWRKQTKYAYYHARLMQEVMPRWSRRYGSSLKQLGILLGHWQDLFVLDQLLASQPDELGIDSHRRKIREMVASSQNALKGQAVDSGIQIFQPRDAPIADNLVALYSRAGGRSRR